MSQADEKPVWVLAPSRTMAAQMLGVTPEAVMMALRRGNRVRGLKVKNARKGEK